MSTALSETVTLIIFNGTEDLLGRFEYLRNEFNEKWGHLTVPDGHFWGRGVDRPNQFYWMVFFKSDATLSQYFEHSDRASFRAQLLELASEPRIFHGLHTRSDMRELLKAPVVEVTHYRLKSPFTIVESDAQCQVIANASIARKPKGYHGHSWALTEERGGEGVFVGGWDSAEEREASVDYEDQELVEQLEKAFSMAESMTMMNVVFRLHAVR